jgi:ribosomal protein S18 acetylase RimI-like enzyme
VRGGRLTPEIVTRIDRWAARERVECLYFLADLGDPDTPPLAAASGFRLVDVRITLERRANDGLRPAFAASAAIEAARAGRRSAAATSVADPADAVAAGVAVAAGALPNGSHRRAPGTENAGSMVPAAPARKADGLPASGHTGAATIRPAAASDLPMLRRLAAVSHRDSRFYFDSHFERERCDALYAAWIEKSCHDPHGTVLVAEMPDPDCAATAGDLLTVGDPAGARLAGYVTASAAPGSGTGRIGLLAVATPAQGQGAGGRLVSAALAWLDARGADPVQVVTQGRNLRAQRLYQRYGLRSRAVELWYHRWSGDGAAAAAGWPS